MLKFMVPGMVLASLVATGCKPSNNSSVKTLDELATGKRDPNKNCTVRYGAEPDVKFVFTPVAKKNETSLTKAVLKGIGSVPPALQKMFFKEMGGGIIVGDEYQANCEIKKNVKAGIPLASCITIESETKGLVIKLPADSSLIARDLALSIFYSVGNVLVWNFDDKRSEYLSRLNAAFALDLINQGITEHTRNPDLLDITSTDVTVAIFANAIDSLTCSEKTAKDMREKFKNTALIVDNMRDWLDVEGDVSAAGKEDDGFSLAGSSPSSGSSGGSSGPLIGPYKPEVLAANKQTYIPASRPVSQAVSSTPLIGPYRPEVLSRAGQTYIPASRPSTQSSSVVPQVAALQRLATGGTNYSNSQYQRDSKTALQMFPPAVVQQAQWQGSRPSVPSKQAIQNGANFTKNATSWADLAAYGPWNAGTGLMPAGVDKGLKYWDWGSRVAGQAGYDTTKSRMTEGAGTIKSFVAPIAMGPVGLPSMLLALPNMHLQGLADPNNPITKGISRQQDLRAQRAAIPLTSEQKQDILSGRMPVDKSSRPLAGETVLRYILANPNLPYQRR